MMNKSRFFAAFAVLCAMVLFAMAACRNASDDVVLTFEPMATDVNESMPTVTAPLPALVETPAPELTPPSGPEAPPISDEERIARMARGGELQREAIASGFGDIGIEDMLNTFGEPDRIVDFGDITRWYYDEGFEIDYTTMSDMPEFENYIYIGPNCMIDFCRGIIPGSTREELENIYGEDIDRHSSSPELVCVGYYFKYGINFVMDGDVVDSIYINSGAKSQRYWGNFVPDR